ncbi:MAG: tRNA dihydrouridine(20/20a) synthase DusA [Alphaproteobacteria bacterium]
MNNDFEISVAPMMDWTDRHCRYFHRLIAPHVLLYTEMVTTGALIHGDSERFLRFDECEHPVALQLGGSDPADLAQCAEMGAEAGYDEINLNCGCPSDRVQSGSFGACLMREPATVANCVAAMKAAVDVPVTVKCRIGIDEEDSFEFLDRFVGEIADKGCETFIIHARSAWLKGLSPKENRDVPPLNYARAHEIKAKYPQLRIILNGGIRDIKTIQNTKSNQSTLSSDKAQGATRINNTQATQQRSSEGKGRRLDGAMIGREAYQNPYFLAEIERKIFGNHAILGRDKIARSMIQYIKKQIEAFDTPVKSITRHMMGLYHHQPGAKAWRRALSEIPLMKDADENVIEYALAQKDAATNKSS